MTRSSSRRARRAAAAADPAPRPGRGRPRQDGYERGRRGAGAGRRRGRRSCCSRTAASRQYWHDRDSGDWGQMVVDELIGAAAKAFGDRRPAAVSRSAAILDGRVRRAPPRRPAPGALLRGAARTRPRCSRRPARRRPASSTTPRTSPRPTCSAGEVDRRARGRHRRGRPVRARRARRSSPACARRVASVPGRPRQRRTGASARASGCSSTGARSRGSPRRIVGGDMRAAHAAAGRRSPPSRRRPLRRGRSRSPAAEHRPLRLLGRSHVRCASIGDE